jgi:hypothetical protein
MSTSLAGRTGIASPRPRDSAATDRDRPRAADRARRRRADRARRRYLMEQRRHDLEVHDDRYLDRSGLGLSPIVVARLWLR